ncbi:MAG: hypothetical protein AB7V46_10385, partial [Thermomicrobiales bacterium]
DEGPPRGTTLIRRLVRRAHVPDTRSDSLLKETSLDGLPAISRVHPSAPKGNAGGALPGRFQPWSTLSEDAACGT